MIEVISEGSNIGISFSGVGGLTLIFYLALETIMLFVSKTFILHKIFLWWRVKSNLRKSIPDWWDIKKVGCLTIQRKSYNCRIVYTKVERNIPGFKKEWTNAFVKVNNFGEIIEPDLFGIKHYDEDLSEEFKRGFNRNKTLEKLGIS